MQEIVSLVCTSVRVAPGPRKTELRSVGLTSNHEKYFYQQAYTMPAFALLRPSLSPSLRLPARSCCGDWRGSDIARRISKYNNKIREEGGKRMIELTFCRRRLVCGDEGIDGQQRYIRDEDCGG